MHIYIYYTYMFWLQIFELPYTALAPPSRGSQAFYRLPKATQSGFGVWALPKGPSIVPFRVCPNHVLITGIIYYPAPNRSYVRASGEA